MYQGSANISKTCSIRMIQATNSAVPRSLASKPRHIAKSKLDNISTAYASSGNSISLNESSSSAGSTPYKIRAKEATPGSILAAAASVRNPGSFAPIFGQSVEKSMAAHAIGKQEEEIYTVKVEKMLGAGSASSKPILNHAGFKPTTIETSLSSVASASVNTKFLEEDARKFSTVEDEHIIPCSSSASDLSSYKSTPTHANPNTAIIDKNDICNDSNTDKPIVRPYDQNPVQGTWTENEKLHHSVAKVLAIDLNDNHYCDRPRVCTDAGESVKDLLYLSNIPASMTYDRLRELVEPFGEVSIIQWDANEPGVAEVIYADQAAAEEARFYLGDSIVGDDNDLPLKAELRGRESGNSLFVGDLTPDVTEAMLEYEFGKLVSAPVTASLKRDPGNYTPIGYGFLTFESEIDADKALISGHRMQVGNANVRVGKSTRNTYIYVSDLSPETTMSELSDVFGRHGSIIEEDTVIVRRSYAFIRFRSRSSAENAKRSLDKSNLRGRITVRYAEAEPIKSCVQVQFHSSVSRPPGSLKDLLRATFSKYGSCSVEVPRLSNGMWRKTAFVTFHGPQFDAALAATEAIQHVKYVSTIPVLCQFSRELIPRVSTRGIMPHDSEKPCYHQEGAGRGRGGRCGARGSRRGGGTGRGGRSSTRDGCAGRGSGPDNRADDRPERPFDESVDAKFFEFNKQNVQNRNIMGAGVCNSVRESNSNLRDYTGDGECYSQGTPRGGSSPRGARSGGPSGRLPSRMGYDEYSGLASDQHKVRQALGMPSIGQEFTYMPVYLPMNNHYGMNALPGILTAEEFNLASAGYPVTPQSLIARSPGVISPGMYGQGLMTPPYAYNAMPDFSGIMGPTYATRPTEPRI
jgi:RNA recognition motif-containing protein